MTDVYGLRGSTGAGAYGGGYYQNPLLAAPVDTATPFSGTRLIEDGVQLSEAIKNGDWLSGTLAGVAGAADLLQFAFNPIAGVVSWVAGWIMDHVEPLKGWLNDLTGDAGEVSAASASWDNIAKYLREASKELMDSLDRGLREQTSQAVDAYKRLMRDEAEHLGLIGDISGAISTGLGVAATIVQVVHDLVRDAIADIIGQFASAVIQALLSLGTLVPKIVADIYATVAKWTTKLGSKITEVIRSFNNLSSLFKRIDPLLDKIRHIFANIGQTGRHINNAAETAGRNLGRNLVPDAPAPHPHTGTPRHPSDGSAGAYTTYNGYEIPELTPARRAELDELAARPDSPIIKNPDGSYSLKRETQLTFNKNPNHNQVEFDRQIVMQEQGLNELSVAEWQHNRAYYDEHERVGQKLQADARTEFGGVKGDGQAVLHGPDQIAGGRAERLDALGDANINKSLGSQWKREVRDLESGTTRAIEGIGDDLLPFIKMNVQLR